MYQRSGSGFADVFTSSIASQTCAERVSSFQPEALRHQCNYTCVKMRRVLYAPHLFDRGLADCWHLAGIGTGTATSAGSSGPDDSIAAILPKLRPMFEQYHRLSTQSSNRNKRKTSEDGTTVMRWKWGRFAYGPTCPGTVCSMVRIRPALPVPRVPRCPG